jgi:hypothetical protein
MTEIIGEGREAGREPQGNRKNSGGGWQGDQQQSQKPGNNRSIKQKKTPKMRLRGPEKRNMLLL